MSKTLKENLFGGFGSFAQVFSHKPVDSKETKEEQELLDRNEIIELEQDGSDTYVQVGGVVGHSLVGIETDLNFQRDQIDEYYTMSDAPEVDEAIDNIINDMVTVSDGEDPVSVNLDKVEGLSEETREKIRDEFRAILGMMGFFDRAYEKCRDWYVTGRQAIHMVVDAKRPKNGIQKLIQLDSRCIRKLREVQMERDPHSGVNRISNYEDFFFYDPNVITRKEGAQQHFRLQQQRLKIPINAVAYVDSGRKALDNGFVPSYLHKAIKVLNSLVSLEDATVIYAVTRAPEKRAFYLDVGSLSKKSAEEYMNTMMRKFQTKLTFNRSNGKIEGEGRNLGIVQDLWLPRREGSNSTEIGSVGESGNALSNMMEPVMYHLEKLYRALKLPKSRIQDGGSINIGGSDLAEVSREEHRFGKYIDRLQRRYSNLFKQILKTQLILKGITTEDDWRAKIENSISFEFAADTFIKEQQEIEITNARMAALQTIEPYVGQVISVDTALRKILKMTDEEIADERKKIEEEKSSGLYPTTLNEETGVETYAGSPLKFGQEGGF